MRQELNGFLRERKKSIVARWYRLILSTYPPEASSFINSAPPAVNPARLILAAAAEGLYDELTGDMNVKGVVSSMEDLLRLRAVQDFTASGAVAFVFLLKQAILGEIEDMDFPPLPARDLDDIASKIDSMALIAFDEYVNCRERMRDLREKESRRRNYRAGKDPGMKEGQTHGMSQGPNPYSNDHSGGDKTS